MGTPNLQATKKWTSGPTNFASQCYRYAIPRILASKSLIRLILLGFSFLFSRGAALLHNDKRRETNMNWYYYNLKRKVIGKDGVNLVSGSAETASEKGEPMGPRQQSNVKGDTNTKSTKVVVNYDVQDDIYIVNATDFGSELLAVRYSSDHKLLAVGGASGALQVARSTTHELLGTYDLSKGDGIEYDPITCIREHPSSKSEAVLMLATFASGHIRCWNVSSGQLKFSVKEPRQSLGLSVCPNNFITTGDDGVLYVYDIITNIAVTKLESSPDGGRVDGHSTRSFAVIFNPFNPHEAISGGWDDCVHFWDIRQKHSVRHVGPAHICGSDALDFSLNGKEILAGSYQKTRQIQLWDYASGRLVECLNTDRFTTSLYAAVYLSDNVLCAGGSDPTLFRAVNIQQKATIGVVKGMSSGVSSIHKARFGIKFPAKPKLNKGRERPNGRSEIPRVAFAAGPYLYEVEFY